MRSAFVGAFFAFLPPAAFAAPVTVPVDAVVMPDTPSGKGDPDMIVCRAPQQIAGSGQLGPKSCAYNYEWWQFTTHGKDLAADGETVIEKRTVAYPTGKGNPDAVTCRDPKYLGGSLHIRHFGPEVCQTNRFWADLIKDRKAVDASGGIVPAVRWGLMSASAGTNNADPQAGYRIGGP